MLNKTRLAVAIAATMGLMSTAGHATTGYFSHGYGTIQSSMGGAGVALPQDAMIAAINPAGMAMLDQHGVVGAAAFSPIRYYTVSGTDGFNFPPFSGPRVKSDNTIFLIPNVAYNWKLDDKSAVGVTVYGNGGMNTEYPDSATTFGLGTYGGALAGDPNAGVDYAQLFINTSYARKVSDNASVGASLIINYSKFKADGIAGFGAFSVNPTALSNVGSDSSWGVGLKIGGLVQATPMVSIGGSFQTKVKNKMDKYAGLFPDGGQFDIPATATIGAAFKVNDKTTIAVDVQEIWYSDVSAVGNPSSNLFNCAGGVVSNCLGGVNGAGFGWDDMTVFKIGVQHEAGNGWTWRAGFATGSQPIGGADDPASYGLNILAPGVVEDHFTFGFGKKLASGKELNVGFMYAPTTKVTGPNAFEPSKTIELEMKQYQFNVGLRF